MTRRDPDPLEAVVFDLDDTLYPERQFVRGGLRAAARHVLPEWPAAEEVFQEALAVGGHAWIFDRGLERLGLARTEERIRALVEAYRAHRPRLALFRGVRELLRDLRGRGVRLALLTQGLPEVQWRKIEALGLRPLFDHLEVAGPEEAKPHPAPFRRVGQCLGLEGRRVAMVGDCPARDFPAAEVLGWRTVRLRLPGGLHRGDPDPDPHRPEVRSIRALQRLLEEWIG